MKILFDASIFELPATGIGKTTLQLYQSCINQKNSLEIFGLHQNKLSVNLSSRIHSIQLGKNFSSAFWRSFILPYYIKRNESEFIHFPWNGDVSPFLNKKSVITSIHDVLPLIIPEYFDSPQKKEKYRKQKQKDINRSGLIVTVSNYSKKEIMDNFDVDTEILVLHHGPTIQPTQEKLNNEKSDYFLYVGGYDKRKGLDNLLKRFIILRNEKKISSKLVIVGEKNYYSPQFKKLVDEGVNKGYLEEKGYISDKLLAQLYSNAIAMVYPSKYEGFGLPPLEAMNLGCPVITTKFTSIPEICGNAAYYIENDQDLDESLIKFENDPNTRKKFISLGKKQSAKFSWEDSARSFLNKITDLKSEF